MAGKRGVEADPWGFLLPLAPLVWVAILTALVVLPVVMFLFSLFCSLLSNPPNESATDAFSMFRVLLQQDISFPDDWWWERVLLGVWMLTTLVLTRSYAGNLMSLLAVRHIPQPYQTLQDVLDDPSVIMIWQSGSTNEHIIHSAQSGIFQEVAKTETSGRIKFHTIKEFPRSVNSLVRRGDHVLIEVEEISNMFMSQDFSHSGSCDFYMSREGFLPMMLSMIGPKNSPLVPAMSE
ncbi:glutamate receptor 4-like, partial [Homarus americanus]